MVGPISTSTSCSATNAAYSGGRDVYGVSGWSEGDLMAAALPDSTHQIITAEGFRKTLAWKLNGFISEEQISLGLSAFGMPGASAYGGLCKVLRPNKGKGEVLYLSAASGAHRERFQRVWQLYYMCQQCRKTSSGAGR